MDNIVNKYDCHIFSGIIGTNAVIHTLPQHGEAEWMYRLATQTTYPNLEHQVIKGATTVGETYEYGPWTSQNMKMFGTLDKFLYRDLAGIKPTSPAYRSVLIQPRILGDLKTVTAAQKTVHGRIAVDWARTDIGLSLKVAIPVGTEATVVIPKLGWRNVAITESGMIVWKSDNYVPGVSGLTGAAADAEAVIRATRACLQNGGTGVLR